MPTIFFILAQTAVEPDSGTPYEKIGIVAILLFLGYLFMTKRIIVGTFYADALTRNRELEDELKAVRKINHDLRNANNGAMLQITELTSRLEMRHDHTNDSHTKD